MDAHLRALNRFGLGARIGELRRGASTDPRGWLRARLDPQSALLPGDADVPTLEEIASGLRRQREAARGGDEDARRAAGRIFRELLEREASAALGRRVRSDAPFVERLVAFWSNHLCVSAGRSPAVAALAGHYERTVVRPHALGRYEEMLLASARHPAMLLYLDNARSVGPRSLAGRRSARRGRERARGLNENYARELLELHTVGVDGGYEQSDVEAAARILTGWTVDLGDARERGMGPGRPGSDTSGPAFVFRPQLHEPGGKTVLGRSYGPGGAEEGEALLRDLARHPSTATFLATKLVRHFVADDPPGAAVNRLASVYRESEGDLLEVSRALIDLEEAWDPAHRKLRTPQDWIVAALRALHLDHFPGPLLGVLRALRHPLWAPPAPKGFDDLTRVWADPDSLMNRAELARSVAERAGDGRLDPALLLEVMEPDDGGALATMLSDASIAPDERLALALGGPAFQWR